MSNEKNNPDQDADFLDEDFDIEDDIVAEEVDDFDDAEWEEEFPEEEAAVAAKTASPLKGKAKKSKVVDPDNIPDGTFEEKSFLKKNLLYIVIGVVVLGGGFFAFSMMGGQPSAPEAMPPAEVAGDFTSGTPDIAGGQPAPDLSTDAPSLTPNAPVANEFDSLPPMPEMTATEAAPPMPAPINSVPEDIEITKPEQPPEKPAAPIAGIETEVLTPMPTAPVAPPPAPEQVAAVEPAPTATLPAAPAVEIPVAAAPVVSTAELDAAKATIESQSEKITALEAKLKKMETQLANQKADAKNKVAAAEAKLKAAQEKAAEAAVKTSAPQPVARQVTPPANITSPVPEALIPEPTRTAPRAVPVESARPSAAPSPKWELRFAQPGKAMLAEKGSSDFRTVETGDSLPGLGKITTIGQENGRWVVRGTRGSVSQ